jgi:hypothetical protein
VSAPRNRAAAQLAREVAAHLRDDDEFADAIARRVAQYVEAEFAMVSPQGWHMEPVHPPWSGYCWHGDHDLCAGLAKPSESGCHCPHHKGDPIPEWGYQLRFDDSNRVHSEPRTEPPSWWPKGPRP